MVAHSQAGVDVRLLLDDPRAAGKIAGVVTLSSPHQGTPLGDLWRKFRGGLFESAIDRIALDIARSRGWAPERGQFRATSQALTPSAMAQFAVAHAQAPVPFFSVAADPGEDDHSCDDGRWAAPHRRGRFSLFMWLASIWLDELAGKPTASDGVVPVRNQRFGEFLGCVPVDHAAWLHPVRGGVDVTAIIVELARGLRDVAMRNDRRAMDPHAAVIGSWL